MSDPEDRSESDTADRPTRLQRMARQGCAGLAYMLLLLPPFLLFTVPGGWALVGAIVTNGVTSNFAWEVRGAHTEIVVLNISGHEVQIDLIRFDEHRDHFNATLDARREGDPDQNIVHYQETYFRDIVPRSFPVEIRYTELDTGIERCASFMADRTPRDECKFVMILNPDGPELSECRRSDLESFGSP
jgi:hypothetical protein